ncbi:TetR/AcrR family transcriptional regulator [Novosphingobium aquimarinum]|uniref:TetR/AcrR family transcriptional regulator n=1 Tax=Novosphingobium aquimarinum TaxID=2682494 RepID=UPI0012EB80E9|nr:TetR/AcrR family transcriptional regulator [Novosphingobium aquimarinum]
MTQQADAPEPAEPKPAARSGEGGGARERIFRAAEWLVAEHGFDGVSTRDIVARAGANVAAVNYHYGSKTRLLLEIFRARATELNRERTQLLRQTLEAEPDNPRAILRALIEPPTLWVDDDRRIALRFLNRARYEGPLEIRELIRTDVRHLRRFADALASALPELPRDEVIWRLHFALGVLHYNQPTDYARLALISDGACTPEDREALMERLLQFICGGFGF